MRWDESDFVLWSVSFKRELYVGDQKLNAYAILSSIVSKLVLRLHSNGQTINHTLKVIILLFH
jgi:hypothetical protein